MREFKFRCYDKNEGYMLPWEHLVQAGDLSEMLLHGHEEDADYSKLMQYTGLKDKNGVEIYEGDILSAFYGTQLTEVKWNSEYGLYEVALQLSGGSETADELLGNHLGVVEVIGNICENPKLLSAKK